MFKRLLFSGVFASFVGLATAGKIPNIPDTTELGKKDTSIIAASEITGEKLMVKADPKEGFQNLYVENNSGSTGIRVEQLNPLAISFVEDYMDKYADDMEELKDWGRPYFDVMETILAKYDLPLELKYLAVVESRLKSQAKSWAGAVGPWQFMPSTARVMGLKVGKGVDERRDLTKSTHAAAKYLNYLYDIYGDWLLVIAAYNGGPGKVNSAIKRSNSRDFWVLQRYLPTESRNHVKKFIATHYIMEGEGGVTTLTKKEAGLLLNNPRQQFAPDSNTVRQFISGRYHSSIVVKHIVMDIALFEKMNPGFDKIIANEGKYELSLPKEKMDSFLLRKPDILAESLQFLLNPEIAAQAQAVKK